MHSTIFFTQKGHFLKSLNTETHGHEPKPVRNEAFLGIYDARASAHARIAHAVNHALSLSKKLGTGRSI